MQSAHTTTGGSWFAAGSERRFKAAQKIQAPGNLRTWEFQRGVLIFCWNKEKKGTFGGVTGYLGAHVDTRRHNETHLTTHLPLLVRRPLLGLSR